MLRRLQSFPTSQVVLTLLKHLLRVLWDTVLGISLLKQTKVSGSRKPVGSKALPIRQGGVGVLRSGTVHLAAFAASSLTEIALAVYLAIVHALNLSANDGPRRPDIAEAAKVAEYAVTCEQTGFLFTTVGIDTFGELWEGRKLARVGATKMAAAENGREMTVWREFGSIQPGEEIQCPEKKQGTWKKNNNQT